MKPYKDYDEYLIKSLKDLVEAAAYLNAALEEEDKDAFLLALRDVTDAQGGMSKLARRSKLGRLSICRIFSGKESLQAQSLKSILQGLGLDLTVVQRKIPKPHQAV